MTLFQFQLYGFLPLIKHYSVCVFFLGRFTPDQRLLRHRHIAKLKIQSVDKILHNLLRLYCNVHFDDLQLYKNGMGREYYFRLNRLLDIHMILLCINQTSFSLFILISSGKTRYSSKLLSIQRVKLEKKTQQNDWWFVYIKYFCSSFGFWLCLEIVLLFFFNYESPFIYVSRSKWIAIICIVFFFLSLSIP